MSTKHDPATTAAGPLPVAISSTTSAIVRDIAERLARSGAFEGASPGQLEPRIWIGLSLGIDPGNACSNITFSRGKPVFTAALQAALLARGPRYGFEPGEITDQKAEIQFFRDGKPYRTATFTIEEAKRAGLTSKSVWQAYPSDLLFARALTRGIRRNAPDLLCGACAYTAEELGADMHEPTPATKAPAKTQPATPATEKPKRGTITDQQLADLKCCRELLQIPLSDWREKILAKRGVDSAVCLSTEQAAELISALKTKIQVKQLQEGLAANRNGASGNDLTVDLHPAGEGKEVAAGPASKSG